MVANLTCFHFSEDQEKAFSEVKQQFYIGKKQKEANTQEAGKHPYTGEEDLFLIEILKKDNTALQYGLSRTEAQISMCRVIAEQLNARFKSHRSAESIFNRLYKFFRLERISDFRYRDLNAPKKPPYQAKTLPGTKGRKGRKPKSVTVETVTSTTE